MSTGEDLPFPKSETADVEHLPEGARVTLRPQGAARWLLVLFLTLWLTGWAAGMYFAAGFLLRLLGSGDTAGSSSAVGTGEGFGLGAGLFLLVWLGLWTFGGLSALVTALRTAWGTDTFTIRPGQWTLRQGVGPLARSRVYSAPEVARVFVREQYDVLCCLAGGKTIELTRYGTEADRRSLCSLLREALGLDPEAPVTAPDLAHSPTLPLSHSPTPPESPILPAGWTASPAPEGGCRLARSVASRIGMGVGLLFINLFWNGIVGVFVAGGLGFVRVDGPGQGAMGPGGAGYWLFLSPFIAVGLAMLWGLLWTVFGQETWRLRANLAEHETRILFWSRTRRHTGATLGLSSDRDSEGALQYTLKLTSSVGDEIVEGSADGAHLSALGGVFTHHTGWPLEIR